MSIVDQYGKPFATPGKRHWGNMLARYDAAQTVTNNERHWQNADPLSADAANSLDVRTKLRNRSRYEIANNSYCKSMIDTVASDVIGTGPRLQLRTGDRDADKAIEREFMRWAMAIRLPMKLRTMKKAKSGDGETFGIFTRNRRQFVTPVQLDLSVIECDRVTDPTPTLDPAVVDGIRFDRDGNPESYAVMSEHPGNTGFTGMLGTEHEWIDANRVIHVFRQDRAEQHRGVPETTPALPLFSQLRRYTLAVLAAAETAADHALVIQTNQLPDAGTGLTSSGTTTNSTEYEPLDVFELTQRMVTVMPSGYQIGGFKAEQPSTTYGEFKREILAEAFAAFAMPYNVGAHDSSEFNFASGKLDRLGYARNAHIEQTEWESQCNTPVFIVWMLWAQDVPGYLPLDGLAPISQWQIDWFWDQLDDIDPEKSAKAKQIELKTFQKTIKQIWAEQGRDWEVEMASMAETLGMTVPEYQKRLADQLLDPVVETAPVPGKEPADAQSQSR